MFGCLQSQHLPGRGSKITQWHSEFEANMGYMGQCFKNPKSQRDCLWKSRLYVYVQGTGFISGTTLTAKEKEPPFA